MPKVTKTLSMDYDIERKVKDFCNCKKISFSSFVEESCMKNIGEKEC